MPMLSIVEAGSDDGGTHLYIFILQRLYIEADCRNCLDGLVWFILKAVKDSGLSGIV